MYWEIDLKPPQEIKQKENDRHEEELCLPNHQLISMLNSSTHIYQKVQRRQ